MKPLVLTKKVHLKNHRLDKWTGLNPEDVWGIWYKFSLKTENSHQLLNASLIPRPSQEERQLKTQKIKETRSKNEIYNKTK